METRRFWKWEWRVVCARARYLRAPNAMQFKARRWIPRSQHALNYKYLRPRLWKSFHLPRALVDKSRRHIPKTASVRKGYAEHARANWAIKSARAVHNATHLNWISIYFYAGWEVSLIKWRRRKFWNAPVGWELFGPEFERIRLIQIYSCKKFTFRK